MSLLEKIRRISSPAARALEEAGFRTDPEIKSLDRTDIYELLGGKSSLKLRKAIFDVIHPKRPVDELVRELKDAIPHGSVRAHSSVLADYLCVLKDMKTQMDSVQDFLNAHISLLEELSNDRPRRETDAPPGAKTRVPSGPRTSNWELYPPPGIQENAVKSGLATFPKNRVHSLSVGNRVTQPSRDLQSLGGREGRKVEAEDRGNSCVPLPPAEEKEVKYNRIVSGTTVNAHQQLLNAVMKGDQVRGYRFSESSRDHQVTLLFRNITSRIVSDADAAMSEIKDNKPVILVLMHHALEPTSQRSWEVHPSVVLQVHVFFHDTKSGLFTCTENSVAITAIRNKLLEYSTLIIPEENLKSENERIKEAEGGETKEELNNLMTDRVLKKINFLNHFGF